MDELDQFFADSFGTKNASEVATPEGSFIYHFTSGSAPRIASMLYWLRSSLNCAEFMRESGINITKTIATLGKPMANVNTSLEDNCKVMIRYYMMVHFLPRFIPGNGLPVADLDKVVDTLMGLENVKSVIKKVEEDRKNC